MTVAAWVTGAATSKPGIRRAEWPTMPAEDERTAWAVWLHRHGVNPATVLVSGGGWVEADDRSHQIRYLAMHGDAEGRQHMQWPCDPMGDPEKPCRVVVTLQGPAKALPFPVQPAAAGSAFWRPEQP